MLEAKIHWEWPWRDVLRSFARLSSPGLQICSFNRKHLTSKYFSLQDTAGPCDWSCRSHHCSAWRRFMLQCPAALLLCIRPACVVGRCIASTANTASESPLSPSFAAPQEFPLRDSVPDGKAPAVYPFRWDPLTISIIGNQLAHWRTCHACSPLT